MWPFKKVLSITIICRAPVYSLFVAEGATKSCFKADKLGLLVCHKMPWTLSKTNKPSRSTCEVCQCCIQEVFLPKLFSKTIWLLVLPAGMDLRDFHMNAFFDTSSLLEVFYTTTGFACYRNVESNLWISHGKIRMIWGCCKGWIATSQYIASYFWWGGKTTEISISSCIFWNNDINSC